MGALRSLPGRLRRAAQLTVLYDGWCSLCTRSVRRLSRLDLLSLVQFVSFRHPGVLERYRVDRARAERRVLGIDARGRIREGADVMVQIAVRLPLLWPLLPVLVVGRLLVGQRLYDALAGRRAVLVPGSRVLSCKQSIHVSPAEVQVGSLMGLTFIDGTVRGGDSKEVTVRFLVDSGATYTLLPQDVWRQLGLVPRRRVTFSLADGTPVERDVSECYIILPQGEGHTPVILGEPGDVALLGAVTLEILGLVLNPFTRELQPMRMMLA